MERVSKRKQKLSARVFLPPPPSPPPQQPEKDTPEIVPEVALIIVGQCTFCLRHLTKPSEGNDNYDSGSGQGSAYYDDKIVPKAKLDECLLTTINKFLPHLKQKPRKENDKNPQNAGQGEKGHRTIQFLPKAFTYVPAMCQFCGIKFQDLHRIVTELNAKMKELRAIIFEPKNEEERGDEASCQDEMVENIRNDQGWLKKYVKIKIEVMEEEVEKDEDVDHVSSTNIENALNSPTTNFPRDPLYLEESCASSENLENPDCTETGNKRKLLNCDLCRLPLPRQELAAHIRNHVGDYATCCPNPKCDRVFSSPSKLESLHLQLSSKCRKLAKPSCKCSNSNIQKCRCSWLNVCEMCGYQTGCWKDLKSHLGCLHETDKRPFSCPINGCTKRFTVRQSVYCHLDTGHQGMIIKSRQKCDTCGIQIGTNKMANHLEREHKTKDIISCKSCQFKFSTWENLLDHMRVHRKDTNNLVCYLCKEPEKYPGYLTLRHHYFTIHNIGKWVSCDICDRKFISQLCMNAHKRASHSNIEESPESESKLFPCDKCGFVFHRKNLLKRHQSRVHPPDGSNDTFICEVDGCGMRFRTRRSLRRHGIIFNTDVQGNRVICEAEGCGKAFKFQSSLQRHKVSVHSGASSRKVCDQCGKTFCSRWSLIYHKRTHKGERPFQCGQCGMRFRQNSGVTHHIKAVHDKKGGSTRTLGRGSTKIKN